MTDDVALSQEVQIRTLIQATENWETLIEDASVERPTWFNAMIPRTTAELGKGYSRKKWRAHADMVEQSGGMNWRKVVRGRAAGTGYTKDDGTVVAPQDDPGFDPCQYTADMVSYNFEDVDFVAWESFLRTSDICVNQVVMDWEFMQQIDSIFQHLPDFTLQRWDNICLEYYMYSASVNGGMYVLGGGSPFQYTATYTPMGDTGSSDITITNGPAQVSALTLRALRQMRNKLVAECPSSAQSRDGLDPMWPLMISGDDIEDYFDKNSNEREDLRYAQPDVLIKGWGSLASYRKWILLHYPNLPRYAMKSKTATVLTLERVDPYDNEAIYIGNRKIYSEAYEDAEYAMALVFLKDVFRLAIPPTVSTVGGGTQFNSSPSLAGEFKWINYPSATNELEEKGKFVARFRAFFEPMKWFDKAICFIYRRCPATPLVVCEPCSTDVGTGAIDIVAGSATLPDGEATSNFVTVELEECLPCETEGAVTVTYGQSSVAGFISKSANAPTYELYLASDADWKTNLASGATVTCGDAAR
jgi:hypothetical protein